MLVLGRFDQEEIEIWTSDGLIVVKVAEFRKQKGQLQVRLGISAPGNVAVHRKEVADAIRRERAG